jgi:hypothetical protein
MRHIEIPGAEFSTPFWLRYQAAGLNEKISALPWRRSRYADQLEALSTDPATGVIEKLTTVPIEWESAAGVELGVLHGFWGARFDTGDSARAVLNHSTVNAFQYANQNPTALRDGLDWAAANGARNSHRIIQGLGNYGQGATFDLDLWKSDIDQFWATAEAAEAGQVKADLLAHIADGVWSALLLGDDVGVYGTPPSDAATWDAMTEHSKQHAPLLPCFVRVRVGDLPAGPYGDLDFVMPQYRGKNITLSGETATAFADTEEAQAIAREIPVLVYSINVEKGDGSSGVVSTTKANNDYMNAAQELIDYHTEFLSRDMTAGVFYWEYDSTNQTIEDCTGSFADYFDFETCVPGIKDAVAQIGALAAAHVKVPLLR